MTKKELKSLAKKIAIQEFKRANATTQIEKEEAETSILKLSGRVNNIHDMLLIDDMVIEELNQLEENKNS